MVNALDADWRRWEFGTFGVPDGYGHCYILHDGQLEDMRRLCERSYRSGGRPQVIHDHGSTLACTSRCMWLGRDDEALEEESAVETPTQYVGEGLRVPIVRLNADGTETRGSARQVGPALDDYRTLRGGPMRIGPGASVCLEVSVG